MRNRRQRKRRVNRGRHGAALIVALVCLALASALLGIVARTAFMQRCGAKMELQEVQAAWLVEAGLSRAVARLAADANYPGEIWNIPAAAFDGRGSAVVRIEVTHDEHQAKVRRLRVQADWPEDPNERIRKSKTLILGDKP
jgi:type II secretory pathway component PulK